MEGWSKKEKGLMDRDDSVVSQERGRIRGTNGKGRSIFLPDFLPFADSEQDWQYSGFLGRKPYLAITPGVDWSARAALTAAD